MSHVKCPPIVIYIYILYPPEIPDPNVVERQIACCNNIKNKLQSDGKSLD